MIDATEFQVFLYILILSGEFYIDAGACACIISTTIGKKSIFFATTLVRVDSGGRSGEGEVAYSAGRAPVERFG